MASEPLNIILTNDDGFSAPGIQTLYTALVDAGFNVHIVAPKVNQSAQGSSLGGVAALNNPIDITEFSPGNFNVDGKPATATLTALDDLFAGAAPDLVISGTNRGENIGESENISGTVNGALQGLFEGVPSIAISAGSFNGSFDAGFANAGAFMVNFLQQLQAARAPGEPLLPAGEGLSVNVPGNPALAGTTVTTITSESTAAFPYAPNGTPNTFAEGFVPNTSPSGSPTAEGSQFLNNHITISPIDGNWGATETARDALAVRLGTAIAPIAGAHDPLNILLINEDGHNAPGLAATRDALLAAGYNVTVLAPATDQSGTGSALFLSPITVTQFNAHDFSTNAGTPASLVALALDPLGLFNGVKPDLVVVGADQGDAVGIENANHSATLGGAITALFNYDVPSIALTSSSGSAASLATSAQFLTTLIENLQATQGSSTSLLPEGTGLSINVPVGATAGNYAFTNIDAGTDANLSVLGNDDFAHYSYGAPVVGTDPHSEGNAFNAGKITVSPIDGSIAVHDSGAYDFLASVIGTSFGVPTSVIRGTDADNTLIGYTSSDTIEGGDGDDVIKAGDGNDRVFGGDGDDMIWGGKGGDRLKGGAGADHMSGGLGSDTYYVDDEGDVVDETGGDGTDKVISSISFDLGSANVIGEVENLTLSGKGSLDGTGNSLDNVITGNAGNNDLAGGNGDDTLNGAAGDDTLDGGAGKDKLNGGDGNDTLIGGVRADTLIGGSGADTFFYQSTGQSTFAVTGRDTVVDFSSAEGDKIDVSTIDANTTLAGNQAFSFIGAAAFSHTAGELRAEVINGDTLVSADVNGDGVAEFGVLVKGVTSMAVGDFVV